MLNKKRGLDGGFVVFNIKTYCVSIFLDSCWEKFKNSSYYKNVVYLDQYICALYLLIFGKIRLGGDFHVIATM